MTELKEIRLNGHEAETTFTGQGRRDIFIPTTEQFLQTSQQQQPKKSIFKSLLECCDSRRAKLDEKKIEKEQKPNFIIPILLTVVFLISATGFFIMWFTELYNNTLISKLVLANNTLAVDWWINPPLHSYLKAHVFNYTNADRYMEGKDKKLIVEDLGPFVYYEKVEKVNVTFNTNNTISYKEKRSYKFMPHLSTGILTDTVNVPNIPMLTAMAMVKESNIFVQFTLGTIFTTTSSSIFKKLPVGEFLWGYEDNLIDLSKTFLSAGNQIPFKNFGMLINRNGTSRDTFTIHTGEGDITKLAVITGFNGETRMNYWSTDECNRVDGTDGSQFPPHLLEKKEILHVYIKDICRKYPLEYDKEVTLFDGIPAWRYKAPDTVFAHPDIHPDNQCFCPPGSDCPPTGLYNSSQCTYGAPILLSFPHFYTGDPKLMDKIEGLKPDPEKHVTFADIHPRLAFPINGASRFQINTQIRKAKHILGLDAVEDKDILPVIWLDIVPGELSDELKSLIYHSSFTANAVQIGVRYGTLLICVTTLALLVSNLISRRTTDE